MDVSIYLSLVIAIGIAAQWIAWRFKVPAILLLLVCGFLLLPLYGITTGIDVRADDLIDDDVLFPFVSLSIAIILFEGGLSLRISELKGKGHVVFRLVTIGVLVTWVLAALAARVLFNFDWPIAALLGAILTVSGPTVVGPLIRFVRPEQRVASLAKWEGICNDPVGAVLAVLVFEVIRIGGFSNAGMAIWLLLKTALVGVIVGGVAAFVLIQLLKRYLIPEYLQSSFFLAVVVATFTASNYFAHEAGLVTVTVLGIILANQKAVHVRDVIEFKENLRVLLISTLFILLASRLRFEDLSGLGLSGFLFLIVLLAIRPLAVFLSTIRTDVKRPQRVFMSWMHPRGIVAAAVSSLFALEFAHLAKTDETFQPFADQAEKLAPITFLVIVGTVAVYGLTIAPLARRLGVAESKRQGVLFAGAESFVRAIAKSLREEGFPVLLVDTNQHNIAVARMDGLPTCFASILSEFAHEEMDLGAIGKLLAMTPNDEVNSMAALEMDEEFGRGNVYQLAPEAPAGVRGEPVAPHLRARLLFSEEKTCARLRVRFATGSTIKKTKLTEEFGYQEFLDRYGDTAVLLFVINEVGDLLIRTADDASIPKSGQTVICLVDPVTDVPSSTAR